MTMLKKAAITAMTIGVAVCGVATVAPTADASARHFSSCTALNKVYPHGVGLTTAHDHTSGTPVRNFKKSDALYRANNGPRNSATGEYDLDRDNDHIACEKL
jgi:hypothetical protein